MLKGRLWWSKHKNMSLEVWWEKVRTTDHKRSSLSAAAPLSCRSQKLQHELEKHAKIWLKLKLKLMLIPKLAMRSGVCAAYLDSSTWKWFNRSAHLYRYSFSISTRRITGEHPSLLSMRLIWQITWKPYFHESHLGPRRAAHVIYIVYVHKLEKKIEMLMF